MPTTPNYNWIIPTITGDLNIWGNKLNTVFGLQDSLVRTLENCNISGTPPSTLQAGTLWINNGVSPWLFQVYDGSAWVLLGTIDSMNHVFTATTVAANNTGDIKLSMQTANHSNWLLCNGAAVSRTTYSNLYNVFGSPGTSTWPFGQGDGSTTFNLPDGRALVLGAIGQNMATFPGFVTPPSIRTAGQYYGEETHKLTIAEMPAHTHSYSSADSLFSSGSAVRGGTNLGPLNTNSTGGDGSHNNMQPTLFAGNYFVYSS
jgi:microcystin-dependent protein